MIPTIIVYGEHPDEADVRRANFRSHFQVTHGGIKVMHTPLLQYAVEDDRSGIMKIRKYFLE